MGGRTHSIGARGRPVVIYDGRCGFCRRQTARIRAKDRDGRFEYLPLQAEELTRRFPHLAARDFERGMGLIGLDGEVRVGADAVYEVARSLPGWRRLAWLYRVPGLGLLLRGLYGWIARNRYRLGGACADGACDVDTRRR